MRIGSEVMGGSVGMTGLDEEMECGSLSCWSGL